MRWSDDRLKSNYHRVRMPRPGEYQGSRYSIAYFNQVCCWHILPHVVLCCAVLCCAVLCCAVLCCAVLCHAMPRYAMLCYAMRCCAMLCYAMPCHAMPYHAMLCYAMLRYAMLCYATLCHAVPRCAMLCPAVPCCAMLCCAMLCYALATSSIHACLPANQVYALPCLLKFFLAYCFILPFELTQQNSFGCLKMIIILKTVARCQRTILCGSYNP